METPALVALIAAVSSLAVAILTAIFSSINAVRAAAQEHPLLEKQKALEKDLVDYKAELDRAAKREEHARSAKAELERAREPLLEVTIDLLLRVDSIRNGKFFAYLTSADPDTREIARSGTFYRLARYWCVVEGLYDRVELLRFQADPSTRSVATTLREVARTFAIVDLDEGRLIVWREQQRAIAEHMRDDRTSLGCVGYATFVGQYGDSFARWFAQFERRHRIRAGQ